MIDGISLMFYSLFTASLHTCQRNQCNVPYQASKTQSDQNVHVTWKISKLFLHSYFYEILYENIRDEDIMEKRENL